MTKNYMIRLLTFLFVLSGSVFGHSVDEFLNNFEPGMQEKVSEYYKKCMKESTVGNDHITDSEKADICLEETQKKCNQKDETTGRMKCDFSQALSSSQRERYSISDEFEGVDPVALMSSKVGDLAFKCDLELFNIKPEQENNIPDKNFKSVVINNLKVHEIRGDGPSRHIFQLASCRELFKQPDQSGVSFVYDEASTLLEKLKGSQDIKQRICKSAIFNNTLKNLGSDNPLSVADLLKQPDKDYAILARDLISSCIMVSEIEDKMRNKLGEEGEYETVDADPELNKDRNGFSCRKESRTTLDYNSCVTAAYAHNTGFIGSELLGGMGIDTYYMYRTANIQADSIQKQNDPNRNAQAEALNTKERLLRDQANKERLKMAMEGARGMGMLGVMWNMVSPKDVKGWCENGNAQFELEAAHACAVSILYIRNDSARVFGPQDGERNLHSARLAYFQNEHVPKKLLKTGVHALTKGIVSAVIANMKDKQADMVGEVKNAWSAASFNNKATGVDTSLPQYCESNPQDPTCNLKATRTTRGGAGGMQMNFNGVTSNPNEITANKTADIGEFSEENRATSLSDKEVDDLTNIMGGSADKGPHGLANKVGNGSISRSGRSGGGGGGGGAGAGGGGGAAGGGGGSAGKGKGAPQKLLANPKAKFTAGNAAKFQKGGSTKSKTKKNGNPFAGLIGNKRGRKVASNIEKELLPKNIRLFTAISDKYKEMNDSGRLEKVVENDSK